MPLKNDTPQVVGKQSSAERHVPGSPFAVHILPRAQIDQDDEGNALGGAKVLSQGCEVSS
jgi:hypothetical protein